MADIEVDPNMDIELEVVEPQAIESTTADLEDNGTLVFTVESDGAYRIALAGLGTVFATGEQIVVRNSVDTTGLIDNDGIYTIEDGDTSADWIEVVEVVRACTSVGTGTVDEVDIIIITPTRKMGKCLIFLEEQGADAVTFSLAPGDFWAGGVALTGTLTASAVNFLQIETSKYLQSDGTLLLTLIPVTGEALEVDVGFIQLK